MANAQSDETELAHQRDAFIAKVFTKCSDSVSYFGPHEMNHLACGATGRIVTGCAELIEYKDFTFPQAVKVERLARASRLIPLNPPGTLTLQLSNAEVYAQITNKGIGSHQLRILSIAHESCVFDIV